MASFEAKIGWKGMRTRENSNYRSVPFRSRHVIENSKEITEKVKKLSQNQYGVISSKNRLDKAEKERK